MRLVAFTLLLVLSLWASRTWTLSSLNITHGYQHLYNTTFLQFSTRNSQDDMGTPLQQLYDPIVYSNGLPKAQLTGLPWQEERRYRTLDKPGILGYIQNHFMKPQKQYEPLQLPMHDRSQLLTNINILNFNSEPIKKSQNLLLKNDIYSNNSLISLDSLIRSEILNQSVIDLPLLVTLSWGKHSIVKKGRHMDNFLADAMLSINQVLENFGLTGHCSVGLGSRLPRLMADITDHTLLNNSSLTVGNYSWEDGTHPVHNLLDRALGEISITRQCQQHKTDDDLTWKKSKSVIKKLDADLRIFMSSIVQIISNLVLTKDEKNRGISEFFINYLCEEIIQITDASINLCRKDLHIIMNVLGWMNMNDKRRYKREEEAEIASVSWLRDEGVTEFPGQIDEFLGVPSINNIEPRKNYEPSYGELSYSSISGYNKENYALFGNEYPSYTGEPAYVIIEDDHEDLDKWKKVKIAFLGTLTIGAYSLLGLLAFIGLTGGLRGPTGYKGETGTMGLNGTKGTNGISGRIAEKGMTGVKGVNGEKGMKGAKGMKGKNGLAGNNGMNGNNGMKGNKGMKGGKGMNGEKGMQGENGMRGKEGMKGGKGRRGENGIQGAKGITGENGMNGEKGVKGEKGKRGEMGIIGEKGMKGDTGIKGKNGMKGEKGIIGEKGMKGDRGVNGDQGMMGEKGQRGVQGMKGEKGMRGAQGIQGDKGAKGDKGFRCNPGNSPTNSCRVARRLRRRELSRLTARSSLVDAPQLLDTLYRNKREQMTSPGARQDLTSEMVTAVNFLWREYKSLKGCIKCSLFDLFERQETLQIDSYILAGFSHILGNSESLQLLDDMREGKRRGIKMRCRPRKNTCDLEYLSNDVK